MMKKLWHFLRTPSRRWSVLALLLVGVGVTLAGTVGLHYGFEKTSSLEFCISCHSMKDTVYPEYKESIHFKNASGVQAVCTDCHQPKDFVGKVARKMASAAKTARRFWFIGKSFRDRNHETGRSRRDVKGIAAVRPSPWSALPRPP